MSQVVCVCVLDWLLKVCVPHSRNFLKVPMTFDLLFYLKNNFQTKKFYVLRRSFDRKLISPNVSRVVQKPLFDLCMSQIVTVLAGETWISFFTHKTSVCSKSPHFDRVTLNNFGCVYLTETNVQWSSCMFLHLEEGGCSGLSLKYWRAMWSRQLILLRKNIESCSMLPHLTVL